MEDKFKEKRWCIYTNFAFATNDIQGTDPTIFTDEVAKPFFGDEDHSRAPTLRWLLIQSYMLAAADLKDSCGPSEAAETIMLPVARAMLVQALRVRLAGVVVKGP